MNNVKNTIKKLISKKTFYKLSYSKYIYSKLYRKNKNVLGAIGCILKSKIYKGENIGESLKKLFTNVKVKDLTKNDEFYYNIDIYKTIYRNESTMGNISIDYRKVLETSLEDLKRKLNENRKNDYFYSNELNTIQGIEILIDRIVCKLEKLHCKKELINSINSIKDNKAITFYEALQRILFFNQLLWQTNHHLNGLGRLDMILISYYQNDIESNIITKEKAKELIKQFLNELHKFYYIKSNVLLGDTGQVIELGGKDIKGEYQYNELTYIFIELMQELQLPDPKVLLRVSKDMPRDLMEKSLKCIQTGIGCPLFANDDVIIDKLIKFGYEKEDAYNYGTSACWEPYIIGKSLDQNNIKSIVFIKPFEGLLEKEDISKIKNKEELLKIYKSYLEEYLDNFIKEIEKKKWEEDPLLSLFTENCIEKNKDIARGGAIYNNYGFTGVGLSNLVNSIINIDKLIFEEKEITFDEINKIRENNFQNAEQLLKKLRNQTIKYGTDNEEVIQITNDIIKFASQVLEKYTNPLGGKYKFGLSAPSYIDESMNFPASFDGRKKGEPFGVHISSDISNAYTELIQFASKLDYRENRFNGNVIDFMVSPSFIENNFEKFVDFLMLSIKLGFFEMQMNVVSSKTLIGARQNPDKFPNLIVRVWGFSAYFKDLPNEYKDYLIERALKSESNS